MIHYDRITAVLDTNVIYPVISRDLLFWFAYYDLYIPKWSVHIFDEWKDVMVRKGIAEEEATKRVGKANLAFPDALVQDYEGLILHLVLPDEKDRHVLAAAIKVHANIIVTNNLKDFPAAYLQTFGLIAKNTDDFLSDIIDLNPEQAVAAFKEMVSNKKNPPVDEYDVLNRLRRIDLNDTADYLQALLSCLGK